MKQDNDENKNREVAFRVMNRVGEAAGELANYCYQMSKEDLVFEWGDVHGVKMHKLKRNRDACGSIADYLYNTDTLWSSGQDWIGEGISHPFGSDEYKSEYNARVEALAKVAPFMSKYIKTWKHQ